MITFTPNGDKAKESLCQNKYEADLCPGWSSSLTAEITFFFLKRDLNCLWNHKAFGGLGVPTQGAPFCLLDETLDIIVWFVWLQGKMVTLGNTMNDWSWYAQSMVLLRRNTQRPLSVGFPSLGKLRIPGSFYRRIVKRNEWVFTFFLLELYHCWYVMTVKPPTHMVLTVNGTTLILQNKTWELIRQSLITKMDY